MSSFRGPRQVKIGAPFQQKSRPMWAAFFVVCGIRIWCFFALLRRALPSLMGPGEVLACIHCPDTPKAALLDGLWRIWLREQDLNLRPSGYEPDELPDCSIPRYFCVLGNRSFRRGLCLPGHFCLARPRSFRICGRRVGCSIWGMPWNFVALDAALLRDKSSEAQRRQAQVRAGHFWPPQKTWIWEARAKPDAAVSAMLKRCALKQPIGGSALKMSNCVLQAWRRPTLPHLKMQYHWRWGVSRPSSGWDRVGAPR